MSKVSKATEYEKFVERLVQELSNESSSPTSLSHRSVQNCKIDRQREFLRAKSQLPICMDVTMEYTWLGIRQLIVFECKCYQSNVDVGDLDEFIAKLADLKGYTNSHKGVMVTKVGFQKGLLELAKASGIGLWLAGDTGGNASYTKSSR